MIPSLALQAVFGCLNHHLGSDRECGSLKAEETGDEFRSSEGREPGQGQGLVAT